MTTAIRQLSVHVYAIYHNEKILLPYFLRHYSLFADRIVLYDNDSTDGSPEVTAAHEKVEVRKLDSRGELRDDLMLGIKNNAWKESRGEADWVIVCDIDEFFWHPKVPALLMTLSAENFTALRPIGFSMFSDSAPTEGKQIYESIRRGVRDRYWSDKVILFNPNKIEEIDYSTGCHECQPTGEVSLIENRTDCRLLHYRHVGIENLLARYGERAARLSKENRENKWGFHYLWPPDKVRRIHDLHARFSVNVVGNTQEWRLDDEDKEITCWDLVECAFGNQELKAVEAKQGLLNDKTATVGSGTNEMERLLIIGPVASGKSYLAERVAKKLGLAIYAMDRFFWYPGGFNKMRSPEAQKVRAEKAIAEDAWIIEGCFAYMADWAMPRATDMIWLDLPLDEVIGNFAERGEDVVGYFATTSSDGEETAH